LFDFAYCPARLIEEEKRRFRRSILELEDPRRQDVEVLEPARGCDSLEAVDQLEPAFSTTDDDRRNLPVALERALHEIHRPRSTNPVAPEVLADLTERHAFDLPNVSSKHHLSPLHEKKECGAGAHAPPLRV